MPKVSQEYLDARRTQILDAAIVCFARAGIQRASMQDIVRECGLSPGAIYNYFKTKDEIIEAIAMLRHSREKQLVREAIEQGSPEKAVERLAAAFLDELDSPPEQLRRRVSVQLWAEAQRNPDILRIVRRSFEDSRKLIGEALLKAQRQGAIKGVDAQALTSFVIAAFHGLVLQRDWDAGLSVSAQKTLLGAIVKALAAPAKARDSGPGGR